MSASNRATILAKVHKVVKKHYKPVEPPADRSVMEHLLYAAVLENADFETADECFARLQENFFDWNEVRVTTITELTETLAGVPDASAAAQRVKKTLQAIFESHYQFDVESLRKQNLGKAVAEIEKYQGVSPFGIAYATQNALGGHAIALGRGALEVLVAVGAINDAEFAKHECPGMERAIPKNKGVEFFSLLHQLGIDLAASPQSTRVKGILAEIDSHAKERLAEFNARRAVAAAAAKEARDQRIAEAREARAQEEREAQAKAAKDAQKAAQKAQQKQAKADAAAGKTSDDKKKPVEDKAKPARPTPPAAPLAKSGAKGNADANKGKKVVSKGLTKRKPK